MMVLVDTSVLLDLLTDDPAWAAWSMESLAAAERSGELFIDDMIWAEASVGFSRIEEYRSVLSGMGLKQRPIPQEALFLAAKAFLSYRKAGGAKTSPLPDFFIGAHAAVEGLTLLTRDPRRVARHFPKVELICP